MQKHTTRDTEAHTYTNVHVCNDTGNTFTFRNNSSKRNKNNSLLLSIFPSLTQIILPKWLRTGY